MGVASHGRTVGTIVGRMKLSLGVVTMVVAALVLVAGVVLGLLPVKASITQLQPQLRLLSVGCGNGYLQTTPPVLRGNLVELPDEPRVYLPKDRYAQQCANAVGWRKYGAWGLTALGVLGLAITLAGAGSPRLSSARSGSKKSAASKKSGSKKSEAPKKKPAPKSPARKSTETDVDGPSAPAGSGGAHRRRAS
jgi:hypothetical protein